MIEKTLTVQIQRDLLSSVDQEIVVNLLEVTAKNNAHVSSFRVVRGDDTGGYINAEFISDDLLHLWKMIKETLFIQHCAATDIKNGTVVVCVGDSGWKDYLLLHHYDPLQRLDSLE